VVIGHFHKSKTASAACLAICQDVNASNLPERLEERRPIGLRSLKLMLPTKRFFILDLPYCVVEIDVGRIWIEETASQGTFETRADVAGARWVA